MVYVVVVVGVAVGLYTVAEESPVAGVHAYVYAGVPVTETSSTVIGGLPPVDPSFSQ
jgi:hypothetical protein